MTKNFIEAPYFIEAPPKSAGIPVFACFSLVPTSLACHVGLQSVCGPMGSVGCLTMSGRWMTMRISPLWRTGCPIMSSKLKSPGENNGFQMHILKFTVLE